MSDSGHAHDFHLVSPSPWPALGALSAFILAIGAVTFMHDGTPLIMIAGFAMVIYTMFVWWRDVVREAVVDHAHTNRVKIGLRLGMALFIVSEVMFFVAFFWAYFHHGFGVNPATEVWPPEGIETLHAFGLPALNTAILITSGFTLMWGMKGLKTGNNKKLQMGILLSVILGFTFLILQGIEYQEAAFAFVDGIYPSTFYMATGFHGFHVFVGACFLTVCYFRARKGHFTEENHIGLQTAEWYWHFVDVVWIFLFVWFYIWGASS